jgi:hypothetical protein
MKDNDVEAGGVYLERRMLAGTKAAKITQLQHWFGRELTQDEMDCVKDGVQIWQCPRYAIVDKPMIESTMPSAAA